MELVSPPLEERGNVCTNSPSASMDVTPNEAHHTRAPPTAPAKRRPLRAPRSVEEPHTPATQPHTVTRRTAAAASAALAAPPLTDRDLSLRAHGSPQQRTARNELAHIDVVAGLAQLPVQAAENEIREDVKASLSHYSPKSASYARTQFVAERAKFRKANKVVKQDLTEEQRRQVGYLLSSVSFGPC
jgi:hypothetical protein